MISHDRDAFQLVSDNVCVLLSPRGVTDVHVYTPERVEARYGIPPRLVPDFIGLKGDTSDDIPGVPGIGDKTASELLVRFGSLEGIYANVDAVPGEKRRQTLIEHREDGGALEAAGDDRARPRARRRPRAGAGRSARPGDHGGAVPPLRVPRAAAPHRRARGSRPRCGGRARGARASAPSAATPPRCGSLLADGGPVGLAGDGDGLLGIARGGQALLIDESDATPALAARCQPARRPQLQGRSAGRWPRPVSCRPSTPSWPRT